MLDFIIFLRSDTILSRPHGHLGCLHNLKIVQFLLLWENRSRRKIFLQREKSNDGLYLNNRFLDGFTYRFSPKIQVRGIFGVPLLHLLSPPIVLISGDTQKCCDKAVRAGPIEFLITYLKKEMHIGGQSVVGRGDIDHFCLQITILREIFQTTEFS